MFWKHFMSMHLTRYFISDCEHHFRGPPTVPNFSLKCDIFRENCKNLVQMKKSFFAFKETLGCQEGNHLSLSIIFNQEISKNKAFYSNFMKIWPCIFYLIIIGSSLRISNCGCLILLLWLFHECFDWEKSHCCI